MVQERGPAPLQESHDGWHPVGEEERGYYTVIIHYIISKNNRRKGKRGGGKGEQKKKNRYIIGPNHLPIIIWYIFCVF